MKRIVTLILVLTLLTSFCCLASAEWTYKDTEMEQEDHELWEKLMALSDEPLGDLGGDIMIDIRMPLATDGEVTCYLIRVYDVPASADSETDVLIGYYVVYVSDGEVPEVLDIQPIARELTI